MHPLVAEHPDWVALERDREQLSRARAVFRSASNRPTCAAGRPSRYARALTESTLNGTEPPAPLPPRAPVGDAHALMRREKELDEREHVLLARLADELLDDLAAAERAILADCEPLVQQLDARLREVRSIVSAANQMRVASGKPRLVKSSFIDTPALARAVQDGRSFLKEPPAPTPSVSYAAVEAARS